MSTKTYDYLFKLLLIGDSGKYCTISLEKHDKFIVLTEFFCLFFVQHFNFLFWN